MVLKQTLVINSMFLFVKCSLPDTACNVKSFEVEEGEFPCLKSLQADNKVMTIAPIAQYLQKRIFSTSSFEMSEQVFCAKIANG